MSYDQLASKEVIERTTKALESRGIKVELSQTKEAALGRLITLIPLHAEIMTGASETLREIGFIDYLKENTTDYKNFKEEILAEKDPLKQLELRKKSVTSEYFIGSVHAVCETGEIIDVSNTGSQLPAYAFTSANVIWVVGTQKIVPNLDDAFKRIKEYVFLLEDARMKKAGYVGTAIGKILIFERETNPNRNIHLIFVEEKLGF